MQTESEILFERLCKEKDVNYQKISTAKTKTPDYRLITESSSILIEVKQLDENEQDKAIADAFSRDEETPGTECPSKRVQNKIKDAYEQLKAVDCEDIATGVILYNNAGFHNYIDQWTVTTAMFGKYRYKLKVPASGGSIVTTGVGFAGSRKLTETSCRNLSFVAVLKKQRSDKLSLAVFHNPFAIVRLEPSVLSYFADEQFIHPNPHKGNWVQWQPGAYCPAPQD